DRRAHRGQQPVGRASREAADQRDDRRARPRARGARSIARRSGAGERGLSGGDRRIPGEAPAALRVTTHYGLIQRCSTKNFLSCFTISSAVFLASPSTVCDRAVMTPIPVDVAAVSAALPAAAPAPAIGPKPGFRELFTVM